MALDPFALATVARFRDITGIPIAKMADAVVEDLLNAASDVIEGYCQRNFVSRAYREFLDGPGDPYLLLRQRPVTAVTRISTGQYAALQVTYTQANSSNASVSVNEAGTVLTLRSVMLAGVTPVTISLTVAPTNTIAGLATAVTTFAGWTGTAIAAYASYPSADLWPVAGLYCMDLTVTLGIAGQPESEFVLNPTRGEVKLAGVWSTGYRNVLAEYTAGYAVVPEDVQLVCVELARGLADFAATSGILLSERLGPYQWTASDLSKENGPFTDGMKATLLPYRETLLI